MLLMTKTSQPGRRRTPLIFLTLSGSRHHLESTLNVWVSLATNSLLITLRVMEPWQQKTSYSLIWRLTVKRKTLMFSKWFHLLSQLTSEKRTKLSSLTEYYTWSRFSKEISALRQLNSTKNFKAFSSCTTKVCDLISVWGLRSIRVRIFGCSSPPALIEASVFTFSTHAKISRISFGPTIESMCKSQSNTGPLLSRLRLNIRAKILLPEIKKSLSFLTRSR